jgi:uncharacterized protein (TIGR03089 family)
MAAMPDPAPADVRRLLEDELRRDGSRPLVTFYDDATGERVELSVVTFVNWVSKTAGLLQDELLLDRGARALVDLPVHWMGPVWLAALWSTGAAATDDHAAVGDVDLVVCGPDQVATYAGGAVPVVALSLLPLAGRFRTPLPGGVVDFAEVVWGQPDVFVPADPPEPDDLAWFDAEGPQTQRDLLTGAAARGDLRARVATEVVPTSRAGLPLFLAPMLAGEGTVWVRHAAPGSWERRCLEERARPAGS